MRRAWRTFWHVKADRLRNNWATCEAEWKAETDGCPLTGLTKSRRDLGLATADLYDAIGGRR